MAIVLSLLVGPLCVAMRAADDPAKADAAEKAASVDEDPEEDPLGPNGACYVCHTTFVKEELAKQHLAAKVGCVKCHGLSDKHANDENIGATKPDILYRRDQVDASCVKCHEEHDAAAHEVVSRFLQRKLPPGAAPICTDCHGTHKIDRSALKK